MLTLLAPDHLDWHRNLANYYEDKLRLFSCRADVPVAVNGCCDEAVARSSWLTRPGLLRQQWPGASRQAPRSSWPILGPSDLGQFQLLGEHNLLNACGAVTAALLVTGELPDRRRLERELSGDGAPVEARTVGPDPWRQLHRRRACEQPGGTVAALKAFTGRQVASIVGGHDRGLDYTALARAIESSLPRPVVFLIGDAGKAIGTTLDDISCTVQRETVPSLEAAVGLASSRPGIEVVLFSPASPTPHDEGSYLDRSRRFRRVAGLGEADARREGSRDRS